MKSTLLSLCAGAFLMLLSAIGFSQSKEAIISQHQSSALLLQKPQQPAVLPSNATQGWYNQAMEQLKAREYFVKELSRNVFGAVNRAHQTGFRVTSKGYNIRRFDFEHEMAPQWQADLHLAGIGRDGYPELHAQKGKAAARDQQVTYRYSGFSVEYINDAKGLRQNFIVDQKPQGNGQLKVKLQLQGDLQARLVTAGKVYLHQKNDARRVEMVYDDLKVWDAQHRPVPARMEVAAGNEITIVVDDSQAAYPLTVDPLNHLPDWTDSGNGLLFPLLNDLTAHVLYGTSVSGAGDVNNDGFDDIVVGAPGYVDILSVAGGTFNLVSVGAAFVYFGSATGLSLNPNEVLQPAGFQGAMFGFSVSKAGDVNGDGLGDVIIGAPGDTIPLTLGIPPLAVTVPVNAGKAYIYYGTTFDGNVNTEPLPSARLRLQQADFGPLGVGAVIPNAFYGWSVSDAGDVNGDGFGDVVIGSPTYNRLLPLPITVAGRMDVYHGGASGISTTPASKITGGLLGGLFGFSVSGAGDVNNDGFDDVIGGAPASIGIIAVGRAYVFHGAAGGITSTNIATANSTLSQPGLLNQTLFGFCVNDAGDVNGDGFGDVIIGEPLALEVSLAGVVAVGQASIYYGSATGSTNVGFTSLTSPRRPNLLGIVQGNLLYGFSVAGVGDMNCDGLDDVIVGEPGGSAISLGTGVLGLVSANALSGKAYVYYGKTTKPINYPFFIVNETSALSIANLLGSTVNPAGDVNGDGNADFLIGAPNGTLNFNSSLLGIVGNAIGYITVNSIGSTYEFSGCIAAIDLDFDNDGVPNEIDLDDDNDGTPDLNEFPGVPITQDPGADTDGDGTPNYADPDFANCGGLNPNGVCTNFDEDGDGLPNSFDLDSDNDGAPDVIEAGGVDGDGDGIIDNFIDTDGDGLSQQVDANNTGAAGSGPGLNAPDFDGDGQPNSTDIDSDGDGIIDLRENGLPDADLDGRIDGFTDADGDGFSDAVDPKNGHSGPSDPAGTGTPVATTPTDTNSDGRYDGNPTTLNPDADAKFNFLDLDDDNDGITDNVEGQTTDDYVLPAAADLDGDGLANVYDSQGGTFTASGIIPHDMDTDGTPDYLDTDTDNDGKIDRIEGHDLNLNKIPDDDVALTNVDDDNDGIDNKFDLVTGTNPTTQGMGNPTIPGCLGPLQTSAPPILANPDRDWRNGAYILPVTLTKFSARKTGMTVDLDWNTSSEINSSHFDIERSENGNDFTFIGKVTASGGSTGTTSYTFTDKEPKGSNVYYRLRMVDKDGHFEFSKTIMLKLISTGKGIFVYPTPVKDQIQLAWQDMPQGNYTIDLTAISGQVLRSYRMTISSSTQVMSIPREANWRSGVYMLRVTNVNAKEKQVVKVIIE